MKLYTTDTAQTSVLSADCTVIMHCMYVLHVLQVFGSAAGLGATANQYTLDAKLETDTYLRAWRATSEHWQSALDAHTNSDMFDWLDYLWQSKDIQLEVQALLTLCFIVSIAVCSYTQMT
jgi:hypothetical protein